MILRIILKCIKMKIIINFLFISVLINCVCLRRLNEMNVSSSLFQHQQTGQNQKHQHSNYVTPSSYMITQNQDYLVRQLIDELTNNLHNKTLINKIRNLDEKNDLQLISNLTGNLEDKDPLMSEYLDQKLRTYLIKIQQQSLNQSVDLMEILKQFQDIVSISNFNLTNEFELINSTELTAHNKQEEFEFIYSKNSTTDLNSTKLSRMEFLTDTLISLLIGKLIGLKIGFFAGKLISSVPFSLKRQCCNTNTWPSDMGLAPTEPTSIIRNQFISMKTDKKSIDNKTNDNGSNEKSSTNTNKSVNKLKNKKKKPTTILNDEEWSENEEEDWRAVDEDDEYEERSTKKPSKIKYSKNAYNFNKQIEESLDEDLDDMPNINFKQYTNYHPIYSTVQSVDSSKNSPINNPNNLINNRFNNPFNVQQYSTTNLPYQTTAALLHPTTIRNRKHYMLLTGK